MTINDNIKDGNVFAARSWAGPLQAGEKWSAHIVTPADRYLTCKIEVSGTGAYIFYVEEGSTYKDNGTPIHIINLNRNSNNKSHAETYRDPVIMIEGPRRSEQYVGVTAYKGNLDASIMETMLRLSTDYLVTFESRADDTHVGLLCYWKEEDI